jgi:hypothetical protein
VERTLPDYKAAGSWGWSFFYIIVHV